MTGTYPALFFIRLVSAGWSMLLIAILTVYRAVATWLERHFGLFPTVRASYLMHFAFATISICHLLHISIFFILFTEKLRKLPKKIRFPDKRINL